MAPELPGEDDVEVATAVGDEVCEVIRPFLLRLRPAEFTDPPG